MADLLIIGCPDEATAETAAAEVSMPPRTVAATGRTPSESQPRYGSTR
jgi:hypothetical protein